MSEYSGTLHYRLSILARYEGVYGFNDVRLRIEEVLDEARSKLAALGFETDVLIREDDGSVPSPAEIALDEEERRRKRWKEAKAFLSQRTPGDEEAHRKLSEKVREAMAKVK